MLRATALLLLSALTIPAAAQPPPWAVESPAVAGDGAWFGLGLDVFFENQKSLRIASQQSVTVLRLPDGSPHPTVVDGDPELLNRKFDLEWELRGAGFRVPLALSCFRLTDLVRVFPTLTFEAATADVTLDILDKPEPDFSTSLQGRGPLFGTEIGMMANLGGRGFTGISYHYRNLPSLQADRSPGFAAQGFDVLHDEVRLSQEIHEVTTKAGYLSPDGKTAYYTGVRARQTDVEIEDELRLRDQFVGRETELKTRSKMDSEVIQAIVGVDRRLGKSIFARAETSFGDQDYGVVLKIAYVGPYKPPEGTQDVTRQKAQDIANVLVPQLRQILADFKAARSSLAVEIGSADLKAYPRDAVAFLLNDVERKLLQALSGPELAAMRDYIQDLFHRTREALDLVRISASNSLLRLASISELQIALLSRQSSASLDKGDADSWLDRIEAAIERILSQSENGDLLVDLCVKSTPKTRAEFHMRPISYEPPVPLRVNTNGSLNLVWRGLYKYSVSRRGFKPISGPLDLVQNSDSLLVCQMVAVSEDKDDLQCDVFAAAIEKECPR